MLITSGRLAAPLHYMWCIWHTCEWRPFIILKAHLVQFGVFFFYQWHNKITGKTKEKQLKYMYIFPFFIQLFPTLSTSQILGWFCQELYIQTFSLFLFFVTLTIRSEDSIKPLPHYPGVTVVINRSRVCHFLDHSTPIDFCRFVT